MSTSRPVADPSARQIATPAVAGVRLLGPRRDLARLRREERCRVRVGARPLDGSPRLLGPRGRRRATPRSVLPHDGLPGCSSALRNESVILPDRAEVITQITFAVCDQCSHAHALWESFEALEGVLRVTGPQQLNDCNQRVTCHAVTELREIGDRWPKVSAPNDSARSALDVTRHCNTVERIARDPSSARQDDPGPPVADRFPGRCSSLPWLHGPAVPDPHHHRR